MRAHGLLAATIMLLVARGAGGADPVDRDLRGPGRFTEKGLVERFAKEKARAEAGNRDAMTYVGEAYLMGDGALPNDAEAAKWLHRAAEKGSARAMYRLGDLYQTGIGVQQDFDKAVLWYRRGAALGDAAAMSGVGWMHFHGWGVKKDEAEAARWYVKSAEGGSPEGMNNLGHVYLHGLGGIEADHAKALEWFTKSAELGNEWAMANLGDMYLKGKGVERDRAKGIEWLKRAERARHPHAVMALAMAHVAGNEGQKAVEALAESAELGNVLAMRFLGGMYMDGIGIAPDPAKGVPWLKKAAESGDVVAMAGLAEAYRMGRGVEKDAAAADAWLKKAEARRGGDAVGTNAASDAEEAGGFAIEAPKGWKKTSRAGMMVVTFETGEGEGQVTASALALPWNEESLAEHVNRWRVTVGLDALVDDAARVSARKQRLGAKMVHLLDVRSPGGAARQVRLVAAVIPAGERAVFVRVSGPPDAVEREYKGFVELVESVRIAGVKGEGK